MMQFLTHSTLEWYQMQISLPLVLMGHWWPSRQVGFNISPNFSMTLSWGSTSLLFSTYVVRFPYHGPPPLLISNFLPPSNFFPINSTQTGVDVLYLPCSTHFCRSPNSVRAPNSTLSKHVILHKCREACTHLWILSMISAPNIGSPAKALLYC